MGRSYPAGVGCLVTDTELETYFANFLLSDHKAFPLYDNELPSAYSRRVLANTADLTDEDFLDTLQHPADAAASLMDAIVCKSISFMPVNAKEEGHYDPLINSSGVKRYTAGEYQVELQFLKFFNHPEQVDCKLYFYPNGMDKDETPLSIPVDKETIYKTTNAQGKAVLSLCITIEETHLINSKSEVLFAVRLRLDDSAHLHFPYKLNGNERYLGAKLKCQVTRVMFMHLAQHENVRYAPLAELKEAEVWN